MIDSYDEMKKVPIVDMTVGDVVDFFEILYARKHGGDEDVKRSVSEVKARFMAQALYNYCNHKEPDDLSDSARVPFCYDTETSDAPAREERIPWDEKNGDIQTYSKEDRVEIVKTVAKKFEKHFYDGNFSTPDAYDNYLFKDNDRRDCMLLISIDHGSNIYATYYIGETAYKRTIPLELSIDEETKDTFWAKYVPIILSLTDELIEQIEEGH